MLLRGVTEEGNGFNRQRKGKENWVEANNSLLGEKALFGKWGEAAAEGGLWEVAEGNCPQLCLEEHK